MHQYRYKFFGSESLTSNHLEISGYQGLKKECFVEGADNWRYYFKACSGSFQSPVDLNSFSLVRDGKLDEFSFTNFDNVDGVTWLLENNGHSGQSRSNVFSHMLINYVSTMLSLSLSLFLSPSLI